MDVYHTRSNKISNENDIKDKMGVGFVVDKMKEIRLRWFGHVERRCVDASVKRCDWLVIEGKKGTGRPKKYWGKVIRQDMTVCLLCFDYHNMLLFFGSFRIDFALFPLYFLHRLLLCCTRVEGL